MDQRIPRWFESRTGSWDPGNDAGAMRSRVASRIVLVMQPMARIELRLVVEG